MNKHTFDERSEAFIRVLPDILRPLVRALVDQGVTAPQLTHLLKRVYVDVADKDFRIGAARPTDTRISVMTGIHRRDVRDIRSEAGDSLGGGESIVSILTTVIGHWLANPEFTDNNGTPIPLSLSADAENNFTALVALTGTKITPQTILDALRRQTKVQIVDDHVILVDPAPNGQVETDQRVHFFAKNVSDHIAAATANLTSGDPPFFERAVYYNNLDPSDVDAIEEDARVAAEQILLALNKAANDAQRAERDANAPTERFRMGVYFYREKDGVVGQPDGQPKGGTRK